MPTIKLQLDFIKSQQNVQFMQEKMEATKHMKDWMFLFFC